MHYVLDASQWKNVLIDCKLLLKPLKNVLGVELSVIGLGKNGTKLRAQQTQKQ